MKSIESPALRQLRDRTEYASLYRQVEAGDPSAESLYIKAAIYARCANRADAHSSRDARRAKFVEGIPQATANRAKRIEAFDVLYAEKCAGLNFGDFDEKRLARLVSDAADAGDARAKAWQLAERIESIYHAGGRMKEGPRGYDYGERELEQIRQLLVSGDPDVIFSLQGLLSSSLVQGAVVLDGVTVDQGSLHTAFSLLGCDAGARCGANSVPLLAACAHQGRCDASSVQEFVYFYDHSPSQAQQVDRYHQQLAAMMNARDFSRLTIAPTQGPPQSTMVFGGQGQP